MSLKKFTQMKCYKTTQSMNGILTMSLRKVLSLETRSHPYSIASAKLRRRNKAFSISLMLNSLISRNALRLCAMTGSWILTRLRHSVLPYLWLSM